MESKRIKVFVSYSHQDAGYLEKQSLLGFLRGLERDGVEFWYDQKIGMGDLWDEEIKGRIAGSDLALVLVSQAFLDSAYCTDVEIGGFVRGKLPILPVILSACDWQRHEWLKQRQFLPAGERTIEEHYIADGPRKRLFLEIREEVRKHVEKLTEGPAAEVRLSSPPVASALPPNPFWHVSAIRDQACFVGREAELRRLRQLLEGGSVVVLGEPKIGKSSLLLALARSWQGEVLGPIDFHAIDDAEDFYASLAEALGLESSKWRSIRAALKSRHVLLLLEELDYAPKRGFSHDDLVRFRPISSENPGFRMVAAARRQLKDVFPDSGVGSAAFSYLVPLTLGSMPAHEARKVLEHPWASSVSTLLPEHLDRILSLAAGHPYKLQRGGHHAYEALGSVADWEADWLREVEQML